jgi:hypothetical protein
MSTLTKTVNNAIVFYDSVYVHRWYDAIGPSVGKYLQEFLTIPSDETSGDATEWEYTQVEIGGANTTVITDVAGGGWLITCAGNEDDGPSMQLGAAAGESVLLDGNYPVYMCLKFAINDVDQTDILFGLSVTDTATLGGVTDGLYLRSVDESALLTFVAEKDGVESIIGSQTMVDGTTYTAEILYDGSTVYTYINGNELGSIAYASPNFPNDEEMRLTLEFLSGEAVANTLTVYEIRMIHLRG